MAKDEEEYDHIFTFLLKHQYPPGFDKNEKRAFRRKSQNYRVERGHLYYRQKGHDEWKQVPRSENARQRILEACHALPEGGHLGRDKTYQKIVERFHWRSMWKDITDYLKTCEVCQRTNDAKFVKESAPLHPIAVKPEVWRQVGVDLIGPLPETTSGNRYIITLVDYFSKWPEAAALPNKGAEGVASFLYKMICRYGCTKILISDQGREFVNKINQNLFQRFKTEHRVSSAYHPQTNGLVEHYNQTLQRSLVKLVTREQDNWDELLDGVLFAYRTSVQKSTKLTPFELMYCRKPILPIEMEMLDDDAPGSDGTDVDKYCEELVNLRKTLYDKADDNIKEAQDRQKRDYDRKHQRTKELEVGMLVLLRNSARDGRKGDKLTQRWLGPYTIDDDLGKGVYRLSNPETGRRLKKAFNGCRLKRYFKRSSSKPVQLDDSELFQLHSPTVMQTSSRDGLSGLMDETIPPLPPPMPPLEELVRNRGGFLAAPHYGRKRKALEDTNREPEKLKLTLPFQKPPTQQGPHSGDEPLLLLKPRTPPDPRSNGEPLTRSGDEPLPLQKPRKQLGPRSGDEHLPRSCDEPLPLRKPRTQPGPRSRDKPLPLRKPRTQPDPHSDDEPLPMRKPWTQPGPCSRDEPLPLQKPQTRLGPRSGDEHLPRSGDEPLPLQKPRTQLGPHSNSGDEHLPRSGDEPLPLRKPRTQPGPRSRDRPLPLRKPRAQPDSHSDDEPLPCSGDKPLPLRKPGTQPGPCSMDEPLPHSNDEPLPCSCDEPLPLRKPRTQPDPCSRDEPLHLQKPRTQPDLRSDGGRLPCSGDDSLPLWKPRTQLGPCSGDEPLPLSSDKPLSLRKPSMQPGPGSSDEPPSLRKRRTQPGPRSKDEPLHRSGDEPLQKLRMQLGPRSRDKPLPLPKPRMQPGPRSSKEPPLSSRNQLNESTAHDCSFLCSTQTSPGGFFPPFFPENFSALSPISLKTPSVTSAPAPLPSPRSQPKTPKPASSKPQAPERNRMAYELMFNQRQRNVKPSKLSDPIVVEDQKAGEVEVNSKWIPELELYESDRKILLSSSEWISDDIVNAAQLLMKQINPQVRGLQSVACGLTMSFDVQRGPFVQIIHTSGGHWTTIVGTNEEPTRVQVYDSLYATMPTSGKAQVANIVATKDPVIELNFVDCQMQSGVSDCGLFAIAFATTLMLNQQPGMFIFEQSQMRAHLLQCFMRRQLSMFPIRKVRRHTALKTKNVQKVTVYCECRMPLLPNLNWIQCNQCKEWFHSDTCVVVHPKHYPSKKKWFCRNCS